MNKGSICLIEFLSFKGHEQKGLRPAIILSQEVANLVIVIPLTTKLEAKEYNYSIEINPSEKNKLKKTSIAMVFQLRAVDKRKIKNKTGEIEKEILDKINLNIKEMLNLK